MIPALSSLLLLMSANGCIGDEVGESRYGGFRPVKSSPVRLVAETLSVVLDKDGAKFNARYWLENPGDTLRSKYGVPIDHTPSSLAQDSIGWEPGLFSEASLSLDGKPAAPMDSGREVKSTFKLPHNWDPQQAQADTASSEFDGWRRWFTTSIKIPPGRHLIELKATLSAFYSDGDGKESKFDAGRSVRNFIWDLSPAGGWGKGVVENLFVRVDVRALQRDSMPLRLAGLPFQRKDSIYEASASPFKLKDARPLQFSWDPGPTEYRRLFFSSLMPNPKWTASTGVSAYPVSNLNDRNLSTAWVAPAGSEDVRLEADLPNGFGPTAVTVCAGYAKSKATLTGNARPQKIKMTWTPAHLTHLNGSPLDSSDLHGYDSTEIRTALEPKIVNFWNSCRGSDPPIGLEKLDLTILQYWEGVYWLDGGHVVFEFEELEPGKKSQDLAVSEIVFLR